MDERETTAVEHAPHEDAGVAEVPSEPSLPETGSAVSTEGPSREAVFDALKSVYDPELGLNIVDLGLVYDVDITGGDVHITYSLTTMGCPIGPLIEDQMRQILVGVDGVSTIEAELVFRPAWSPEMMSDEAKAALGIF